MITIITHRPAQLSGERKTSSLDAQATAVMYKSELHQAIAAYDLALVSRLINDGADVNAICEDRTALMAAIKWGRFGAAQLILDSPKFDPNASNRWKDTALHFAASCGHEGFIRYLLKKGADVDAANLKGDTPLAMSAWYNAHRCAEVLMENGASLTTTNCERRTPLLTACNFCNLEAFKVLLRHGSKVNVVGLDGRTALMCALPSVYNRDVLKKKVSDALDICDMLIEVGCDLNVCDDYGNTALHHAVQNNCEISVCLLAERNCCLNIKNAQGNTPLDSCFESSVESKYEIAKLLLYYGAKVNALFPSHLLDISPLQNQQHNFTSSSSYNKALKSEALRRLLHKAQLSPSSISIEGMSVKSGQPATLLQGAQSTPCFQTPRSLQHCARISIRDLLSGTNILPKIRSLDVGDGLRRYLSLDLRTDVHLLQLYRLHVYITEFDNTKATQTIKGKMFIDFPVSGKLPLETAIQSHNALIVQTLLTMRPRSQLIHLNSDGDSVLHLIACHGYPGLASLPLFNEPWCCGNTIDDVNRSGLTPLQTAVLKGKFQVAEELLQLGAAIVDESLPGPLIHLSACCGAKSFVQLLLSKGVNPNLADSDGNMPLHLAASKGNLYLEKNIKLPALFSDDSLFNLDELRRALTHQPFSLTRKDVDHAGVIVVLLQHGADPLLTNSGNSSALDVARAFKAFHLAELMQSSS